MSELLQSSIMQYRPPIFYTLNNAVKKSAREENSCENLRRILSVKYIAVNGETLFCIGLNYQ